MNSEEYRFEIERKILLIIDEQLRSGQMSAERAKEIAQYVVSVLYSGISVNEIHQSIAKISQKFTEFSQVEISSRNEYEEKTKATTLPQVHGLISEGNIDTAIKLLKEATQNNTLVTRHNIINIKP